MKSSSICSSLILILLSACSPTIQVSSDYDKQVDFTKYKTYFFAPESMNLGVNELNQRRIIADIETQLATKGLTKAESGDLIVDVRLTAQERQEQTAHTSGGYGGYRWGGGMSTTSISTQTYVDGTLIITLVDASKKEMVWQGTGVRTLDTDATAEQREENINNAVAAVLKNYPPVKKKY